MVWIAGWLLQFGQFKNVAIEFSALLGLDTAQTKMADAALALFDLVGVQILAIFHVQLRQIENVARRVMSAKAGKGTAARAFEHVDFRIFLLEPGKNDLDILHLEAEVIKARLASRGARIEIQSDVAVADHNGAAGARQTGSSHAENVSIKVAFIARIAGYDRHVSDLRKHEHLRSRVRFEFKLNE